MSKEKVNSKQIYDPRALETKVIQAKWWPEWLTVTIKELSYADVQGAAKRIINASTPLPKSTAEAKRQNRTYGDLELDEKQFYTLLAGIESWGFTNETGEPLPLSIANIRVLGATDADFIEEAIDALNPDVDEEFQGDGGNSDENGEGETTT